jgi:hypothetical protein
MFCFEFQALPKPSQLDLSTHAGAFANCWVQRESLAAAEAAARALIDTAGWTVSSLDRSAIVTRETQAAEGMAYFEQAEIDGEVVVFHMWPSAQSETAA